MDKEQLKTPLFTPLDPEIVKKVSPELRLPYEITMVSIEGPNASGKSAIARLTAQIIQVAHAHTYPVDRPMRPVIGVSEPPDFKLKGDLKNTWRSLAKSGGDMDGTFTDFDFNDQYFRAGLFIWGRRILEEKITHDLPLNGIDYNSSGNGFWRPRLYVRDTRQQINTQADLRNCGATVIKDRGHISTLAYQGLDKEKGELVRRASENLYNQGFLRKEDLSIIVRPVGRVSEGEFNERDEEEADDFTIFDKEGRYSEVIRQGLWKLCSNCAVVVDNDPSGEKNKLSMSAFMSAFLISAVEQGIEIEKGREFDVQFPYGRVSWQMSEVLDVDRSTDYQQTSDQLLSGEPVTLGDVTVLNITQDTVKLVVR
jgi:thymidylate kinase